jgi:hypothetical protein
MKTIAQKSKIHPIWSLFCYVFPKNLARFEPGSNVSEADSMSTAQRSHGRLLLNVVFLPEKTQVDASNVQVFLFGFLLLSGHRSNV